MKRCCLLALLVLAMLLLPLGLFAQKKPAASFSLPQGVPSLYRFLSPETAALGSLHDGFHSVFASLFNPAAGALKAQAQWEGATSFWVGRALPFSGPGSSAMVADWGYFGDFVSLGLTLPTDNEGAFTATVHHLQSLSAAMPSRNQGMLSLSWAMPLMDTVALGVGLKGSVSSDFVASKPLWAVVGDIGLAILPKYYEGVRDLFLGLALQNIGWGTLPQKAAFFPLFTPSLGIGFSFHRDENSDLRMSTSFSVPSLRDFECAVGFDLTFQQAYSLLFSSSFHLSQAVPSLFAEKGTSPAPSYASVIPSVAFRYRYASRKAASPTSDSPAAVSPSMPPVALPLLSDTASTLKTASLPNAAPPVSVGVTVAARALEYEQWGLGASVSVAFGDEKESLSFCNYRLFRFNECKIHRQYEGYQLAFAGQEASVDDADCFLAANAAARSPLFSDLTLYVNHQVTEPLASVALKVYQGRRLVYQETVAPSNRQVITQNASELAYYTNRLLAQLPKGRYSLQLEAVGVSQTRYRTQTLSLLVDDLYYLKIDNLADFAKVYSLESDKKPIVFKQSGSFGNWEYTVRDKENRILFHLQSVQSSPQTVEWDAMAEAGQPYPDAVYRYEVSLEYLPGRRLTDSIETVLLDSHDPTAHIEVEPIGHPSDRSIEIFPYITDSRYGNVVFWHFWVVDSHLRRCYQSQTYQGNPKNVPFSLTRIHGLTSGAYRVVGYFSNIKGDIKLGISDPFSVP